MHVLHKRRLWWLLLLGFCCPLALAQPCIGVVPGGGAPAFWNLVRAGAMQAGGELGVPVYVRGPSREGEESAQLRIIDLLVQQGCRALVIAPAGPAIGARALDLRAQGIPTLFIDRDMGGDAVLAVVGTDNYAAGMRAGQHLASLLGGHGSVLLVRLDASVVSTRAREEGFLRAAREAGLTVIDAGDMGDDSERIQQWLTLSEGLVGVFSPNALTTTATHAALRRLGRSAEIRHVGFDSSPTLVRALAAGDIAALVLQQPRRMGYEGVRLAVETLAGRPPANPPRLHSLPVVVATTDNLREPAIAELLEFRAD